MRSRGAWTLVALLAAATAASAGKRAPAWHEEPSLLHRLNQVTRTRATPGNTARLLVNGVESFARRRENLEDAEAIFLKTFILRDDETGRATVDLLKGRLAAGAQVFVQFDVKGSMPRIADWVRIAAGRQRPLPPLLAELEQAGAVVVPTHSPNTLRHMVNGRDHEKYLFTWKRGQPVRLITGGMNVADAYAFGGDPKKPTRYGHGVRDTDVEIVGPAVRDALRGFLSAARRFEQGDGFARMKAAAREIERDPAAYPGGGRAKVRYVANRPSDEGNARAIEHLITSFLDATPSGETVTMSSAFFLPNDGLVASIVAAAKRGVSFHLLVNGSRPSWREFNVVATAARSLYRQLLHEAPAGAIRIFEWLGRPDAGLGPIHQKVFGFGKNGPVIIGSSNLDAQSLDHNTEGVVVVHDPDLRRDFDAMIERDVKLGAAKEIALETLAADPWWQKTLSAGLHHFLGSML